KDGLLLCGESANLLMNAGKAIQGMDFAMRSGILGAETIVKAKNNGDFSSAMLKEYRTSLNNSHVMKDINNFQDAVHMLHNPTMYKDVANLICDCGRNFFTIDSEPTPKARELMSESITNHPSCWELMKRGFKGARSL